MILLSALLLMFAIIHINSAMPAWKAHAVATFGRSYGAVQGIATLAILVGAFWAFRQIMPVALYEPPSWARYANFGFSLAGFIFIGIFLFRGSWRNRIRFPMAIGICLWATGHLLANGDQRTTLLFGGLAAIALLHAVLKSRNGLAVPGVERQGHNLLSVLGGIVLYGLAAQLHMVIAGVPLVTLQ